MGGTYVESSGSNVGTDEGTLLGVAEFEESIGALLLLLLAMKFQHRQVDVVEEFGVIFDAVAAGEENNDLFLQVPLEE